MDGERGTEDCVGSFFVSFCWKGVGYGRRRRVLPLSDLDIVVDEVGRWRLMVFLFDIGDGPIEDFVLANVE